MKETNYNYANAKAVSYDQGLRTYMLGVYNYMVGALLLTGLFALGISSSPSLMALFYNATGMTALGMIVTFAPLGIALLFGFKLQSMKLETVQMLFWLYACLLGMSLSSLFLVYTGESLARVFFITASVFGTMSLYGYTTKKDLTTMGSYLFMALIGVIVVSLVNAFTKSSGVDVVVSFATVLIFVGLTAYDTQKIKNFYYTSGNLDKETAGKMAVMGAFALYLDFINIFLQLLRFFGNRRGE
jgi:FtsH-binding integral membrane protein